MIIEFFFDIDANSLSVGLRGSFDCIPAAIVHETRVFCNERVL